MGILPILFLSISRGLACCINPQPGRPGEFDQGFLPLVLDMPVSTCKAAKLVLFRTGYFISPVPNISGEHSPIHHPGSRPIED